MAPSKRAPGDSAAAQKAKKARARIVQSMESLAAAEEKFDQGKSVQRIVQLLHENPDKINNVLLYLDTHAFRKYNDAAEFHPTLIYMRRLPKKWVTCFLCEQFPGLSDMLNIWNKHNRESCHHVLYRLTGMNPADKVPSLSKEGLTKILRSRVAQYNLSPGRLGLSTQPLDWATQGWFELVESSAGSSSSACSKKIKCDGFPVAVVVPAHIQPTSQLSIANNYALRSATLVMTDAAREHTVSIYDLFSLIPGFSDFASLQESAASGQAAGAPAALEVPVETSAGSAQADHADRVKAAHSDISPSKLTPKAWAVSQTLKNKLVALKK